MTISNLCKLQSVKNTSNVIRNIVPGCETCLHFIPEDNLVKKIFLIGGKTIGTCRELFTYVEKNQPPRCNGKNYKHYLDRLLD